MSDEQSTILTLWVAHTWAIQAADCTPYIAIRSAEKRSGKTRLLEVMEMLVCNPLRSVDITEAALLHMLDSSICTLLLDEVDTIFGGGKTKEGLRALLNAGYRRGSKIIRMKGTYPVGHDAFGAKALSGIGFNTLPDTVEDRSIGITLDRKGPDQKVDRFRMHEVAEQAKIIKDWLRYLFGYSQTNKVWLAELKLAKPKLPEWLNDRQQDSWEPLFALAEAIGEGWQERLWTASESLC